MSCPFTSEGSAPVDRAIDLDICWRRYCTAVSLALGARMGPEVRQQGVVYTKEINEIYIFSAFLYLGNLLFSLCFIFIIYATPAILYRYNHLFTLEIKGTNNLY